MVFIKLCVRLLYKKMLNIQTIWGEITIDFT